MIKIVTHENGSSKANGTSLIDYLDITYNELVDLFGQPQGPSSDGKVSCEWHVSLYNEHSDWTGPEDAFVTIYNYKDGKNYLGPDGLNVDQIVDWHVGGKSPAAKYLLESYIKQQKASRVAASR